MSNRNFGSMGGDSGKEELRFEVGTERKAWIETTASNYGIPTDELLECLLRYGLVHQEDAIAKRK